MNTHKLSLVRDSLVSLHSALLAYQKHEYEQSNQKISSPSQYFQLVTSNSEFAWLRSLSELIVGLDEMCDHPEKTEEQKAQDLLVYTQQLLTPSESGSNFGMRYYRALQKSPEVAMRHGATLTLLVE